MASNTYNVGVKIGLQGEREFNSELQSINKELRSLGTQLSALDSEMKRNGSNTDSLKEKYRLLQEQEKALREKKALLISRLEEEKTKLSDLSTKYEESRAKTGQFSQETLELANKMQNSRDKVNDLTTALADTQDKINGLDSSKAQELDENMRNVADSFEVVGQMMSEISQAAAEFLTDAITTSASMDTALAELQVALGDLSTGQLDNLRQSMYDLSNQTGISIKEIEEAYVSASHLGIAADEIPKYTKNMADLSRLTGENITQLTEETAKFQNATGMTNDQLGSYVSSLVQAANVNPTFADSVSTVASRMGYLVNETSMGVEDLIGWAAAMAGTGEEGQRAATNFAKATKTIEEAVAKGGDQLDLFAKTAGMSSEEFQKAWHEDASSTMKRFLEGVAAAGEGDGLLIMDELGLSGDRVYQVMKKLAGTDIDKSMKAATDGWKDAGYAAKEAGDIYESSEDSIKRIGSTWENIKSTIGDSMMDFLGPIFDKVADILAKIQEYLAEHPRFAEALGDIAGVLAIITPLLLAIAGAFKIKQLLDAGGAIATVATTLGPIAALIAGIIVVVKGLYDHCKPFRDFIDGLIEVLKGAFKEAIEFVTPIIDGLKDTFKNLVDAIGDVATGIKDRFKEALEVISGPAASFKDIWGKIKDIFQGFWDLLQPIISTLRDSFAAVWQAVVTVMGPVVDIFKETGELMGELGRVLLPLLLAALMGLGILIAGAVIAALSALALALAGVSLVVLPLIQLIADLAAGILGVIKWVIEFIKNLAGLGAALITGKGDVGHFVDAIKNQFLSIPGEALKWGKHLVGNFVDGIKSGIGRVGDAVGAIAKTVKNVIGFSVPKEGPLHTQDKWAGHMMDNFINGMDQKKNELASSVRGVAAILAGDTMDAQTDFSTKIGALVSGGAMANGQLNASYQNAMATEINPSFEVKVGNEEFKSYVVKQSQKGLTKKVREQKIMRGW